MAAYIQCTWLTETDFILGRRLTLSIPCQSLRKLIGPSTPLANLIELLTIRQTSVGQIVDCLIDYRTFVEQSGYDIGTRGQVFHRGGGDFGNTCRRVESFTLFLNHDIGHHFSRGGEFLWQTALVLSWKLMFGRQAAVPDDDYRISRQPKTRRSIVFELQSNLLQVFL